MASHTADYRHIAVAGIAHDIGINQTEILDNRAVSIGKQADLRIDAAYLQIADGVFQTVEFSPVWRVATN